MVTLLVVAMLSISVLKLLAIFVPVLFQFSVLSFMPGPSGNWLCGNLPEIVRLGGIHRAHERWVHQFGMNFSAWSVYGLKIQYGIVTASPCVVRHVLRSRNFVKQETILRTLIGNGLQQNLERNSWRCNRRLLLPHLKISALRSSFINLSCNHVRKMLDGFEKVADRTEILKLNDPLISLSLDVMGEWCFSSGFNALGSSHNEMKMQFDAVFAAFSKVLYNPWCRWVYFHPSVRALAKASCDIRQTISKKVFLRQLSYFKGDTRTDFVAGALESGMLLEEIVDECITMLFAGQDLLLTWTFYLLAKNASWQRKVQMELDCVLGKDHGLEDIVRSLDQLLLVDCVLKETLRLYPPATVIIRKAVSGECVSDTYTKKRMHLPAGAAVVASVWAMHRSDDLWKDAHIFNPERFLPENKSSIYPGSYLPFGDGERACIGKNFAELQAKIVISSVLAKFSVHLVDDEITEEVHVAMVPSNGMPIRLSRRRPHDE